MLLRELLSFVFVFVFGRKRKIRFRSVSSLRPMSHLRFCRASLTHDSDARQSCID